jgi:hypothetical protein
MPAYDEVFEADILVVDDQEQVPIVPLAANGYGRLWSQNEGGYRGLTRRSSAGTCRRSLASVALVCRWQPMVSRLF